MSGDPTFETALFRISIVGLAVASVAVLSLAVWMFRSSR